MPRMGKTEEDWNGLKLGFLKTVQPNSLKTRAALKQGIRNPETETETEYGFVSVFLAVPLNIYLTGAHQMEPPSPLISWVKPFPSRFTNRTACFPRKVSYFLKSRMSRWKKQNWMKSNSEARPSTVFLFLLYVYFYNFKAAGIWVSWNKS